MGLGRGAAAAALAAAAGGCAGVAWCALPARGQAAAPEAAAEAEPQPHPPPPTRAAGECANLVLSVVHTHVSRVLGYLATLPAMAPVQILGVAAGSSAKQKAGRSWSDIPLLLRAPGGAAGAAAVAASLADDALLTCALRKVFVVEPTGSATAPGSLQEAAEMLAAQLDAAASAAGSSTSAAVVGVRLQAFPASLLKGLLQALHDREPAAQAASAGLWALSPQADSCGLVGSVVRLPGPDAAGGLRLGVADVAAYAGRSRQQRAAAMAGDEAVCRAFFKLQEAVTTAAPNFDFASAVAVDAGSAPGGWTQYLLERGCARIYSVDPGELALRSDGDGGGGGLPVGVRHLKQTIQEALPKIAAELATDADSGALPSRLLDVFVSDLVPHREHELVDEVVRPMLSAR